MTVTTRAFVPMSIDLVWCHTSLVHLGDLQLPPYPVFKAEDLWFVVNGLEASHSVLLVQSERARQLRSYGSGPGLAQ